MIVNPFDNRLFVELGTLKQCIPVVKKYPQVICIGFTAKELLKVWQEKWRNLKT
jgi:hypothetical protein